MLFYRRPVTLLMPHESGAVNIVTSPNLTVNGGVYAVYQCPAKMTISSG